MNMHEYVSLDRRRDVAGMINTTFSVFRQVFPQALRAMLPFVLPFVALAIVVIGLLVLTVLPRTGWDPATLMEFAGTSGGNPIISVVIMVSYYVFAGPPVLVAWNMLHVAMLEYHNLKRIPDASEIRAASKGTWGTAIGTMVLLVIVGIVVCIALMVPIVALAVASPVLAAIFGVLYAIVLVFLYMMCLAPLSIILFVRYQEGLSFTKALVRSFNLMKGKWWSSLGYEVAMNVIMSAVYMAVYAVGAVGAFVAMALGTGLDGMVVVAGGVVLGLVGVTVLVFALLMMLGLYVASSAVLYFNRKERLEGAGLMDRIEMMDVPGPDMGI